MAINPVTLAKFKAHSPLAIRQGRETQDKSGAQGFGRALSGALDNLGQMRAIVRPGHAKLAAG